MRPFFSVAVQHLGPFAANPGNPIERFDVVHQRRLVEDPDLRHERRTMARHPALAFDAFDHRAFFAADISTRTTAQIDIARRDNARVFQRFDFAARMCSTAGYSSRM